eukprot:GFYU01002880.1.p1 GENE.GFYU01002880.1~~GFYU01002880.1.p1  ORF type:complete len:725 (+),score=270.48 GFYU01002880.1:89-2263(+)
MVGSTDTSKVDRKDIDRAVKRLQRHFSTGGYRGRHSSRNAPSSEIELDASTLKVVLELHEYDVRAAIQFLDIEHGSNGEVLDAREFEEAGGVPSDYHDAVGATAADATVAITPAPTAVDENTRQTNSAIAAMKGVFLQDSKLATHWLAQNSNYARYCSILLSLVNLGVEFSGGTRSKTKAKILAAAWARRDHELISHLLALKNTKGQHKFGIGEIVRALQLLDGPRKMKEIEAKIARLSSKGSLSKKLAGKMMTKINDIRSDHIGLLGEEQPKDSAGHKRFSLPGSLVRRITRVIRDIPASDLEYWALQMPTEPWRQLADLLHLHPTKDFAVPWFLPFAFGADPPAGSLACDMKELLAEFDTRGIDRLARNHDVPQDLQHRLVALIDGTDIDLMAYVRAQLTNIPLAVREALSRKSGLDNLLWWHEAVRSDTADTLIVQRLTSGEAPHLPYGKLMERLLYFQEIGSPVFDCLVPIVQSRLEDIRVSLDSPVAVLGDASFSMDVAIKTATIISAVLAAISTADLKFFGVDAVTPSVIPRTIQEVLQVLPTIKAAGMTAPAAALYHYYKNKIPIKTFVVVTDEKENLKSNGYYFHQLFLKYTREVYPARLVLVSFIQSANEKTQMYTALEKVGVQAMQFRLDGNKPDLTKLDTLLGLLSAESADFDEQVLAKETEKLTVSSNESQSGSEGEAEASTGGAAVGGMTESFVAVDGAHGGEQATTWELV